MTTWTEVRIPVPWGYVAAKTWGSVQDQPTICIHGDHDNAASFDYLIPLLPKEYYYFCIDLPGHGQSSHFGPGIPYRMTDFMSVLKRVVDYFKWKKVNVLGHHSGGLLGFFFSSCFSDIVEKLIVIDAVIGDFKHHFRQNIARLSASVLESEKEVELLTYHDVCNKIKKLRNLPLTTRAEKILVDRNTVKENNYVKLTLDPRVNFVHYPSYELKHLYTLLKPLKCQLLIFMSKNSLGTKAFPIKNFINMFRKNCAKVEYNLMNTGNDVHINEPEKIAIIIYKFLAHPKSSL